MIVNIDLFLGGNSILAIPGQEVAHVSHFSIAVGRAGARTCDVCDVCECERQLAP